MVGKKAGDAPFDFRLRHSQGNGTDMSARVGSSVVTTAYPVYILDLDREELVVFPDDKADIPHSDFWEQTVAPFLADHFSMPLKPLLNLPYCQRRARISSRGVVFDGEQSKILWQTVSRTTGETDCDGISTNTRFACPSMSKSSGDCWLCEDQSLPIDREHCQDARRSVDLRRAKMGRKLIPPSKSKQFHALRSPTFIAGCTGPVSEALSTAQAGCPSHDRP